MMSNDATVTEHSISTSRQTFRYLKAGSGGVPIVLLHGWPQSADEFRQVMPYLAADYFVVAPDLRGIGGTSVPTQDWRKATLAEDLDDFITALGLDRPVVIGHDIGGLVAYAYSRLHHGKVVGVGILDIPLPGLDPWDELIKNPLAWHIDFHAQKPIAEQLVMDRQFEYIRYFINHAAKHSEAITDDNVAIYAAAYGSLESLAAGFELYRAFMDDGKFFDEQRDTLDLPILLVGAEMSLASALPIVAAALEAHGVTNVRSVVIDDSGHWIFEEQPAATAQAIQSFISDLTGVR